MAEKRLIILVEGDSEVIFINRLIIPKLYEHIANERITTPWSIEVCKIITNRQLNKKGGNVNYDYLKTTSEILLHKEPALSLLSSTSSVCLPPFPDTPQTEMP